MRWSPSHLLSTVVWAATETPLIHGATSFPLLRLGEYHQLGITRFLAFRLENLVDNLQHKKNIVFQINEVIFEYHIKS